MQKKILLGVCIIAILGGISYGIIQYQAEQSPTVQTNNKQVVEKHYYSTIAEAKLANPNNTKPILVKVTESW